MFLYPAKLNAKRPLRGLLLGLLTTTASSTLLIAAADQRPENGTINAVSPESSDEDLSHVLDVVTVTAERREQRLVDVPTTIIAKSGEQLRDQGVTKLVDLTKITAGVMTVSRPGGGEMPSFTIRGVGFDDVRPNGNPSTSLNIDGVYQGSAPLGAGQFFDIERVEVLKGPQGTLYGQNSTAGAINMISRRGGDTLDAYVSGEYGNYNTARLEGGVGGPVSDVVRARISGLYSRTDGYLTNLGTGELTGYSPNPAVPPLPDVKRDNTDSGHEFFAGRAIIDIAASDRTDISLNLHGSNRTGGMSQLARATPRSGYPANNEYEYDSNIVSLNDVSTHGVGVEIDHDLDDQHKFVLVASYDALDRETQLNLDDIPLRRQDTYYSDDVEQTYLEARLQNDDKNFLNWIVGVTSFSDTIHLQQTYDLSDLYYGLMVGEYKQTRDSYGIFGDSTLNFDTGTKIGLGLRYSSDESSFAGLSDAENPYGNSLLPILIPTYPFEFSTDYEDSDFSGRLFASQSLGEWSTAYGSVRRGYKGGGFDATTPANDDEAAPFGSETVWAYELGLKVMPPSSPLQFELAAFYNDYNDLQASAVQKYSNGFVGATRANVGSASTWGLELSAVSHLTEALTLELSASYLGNEIEDIVSASPAEQERRLNNELPFSPEFSGYGNIEWVLPLKSGLDLKLSASGQYTDDFYFDLDNYGHSDSRFLVGARAELEIDEKYRVAVWGRNLTDEYYPAVLSSTSTYSSIIPGEPMTYGISLEYKY